MKIEKYIWEHDDYRYALGTFGKRILIFIGLHPSIAIPEHPDTTYQVLDSMAKNQGYDGLVLVNLYPKVIKDDNLSYEKSEDNINEKNFEIIRSIFLDFDEQNIDYTVLCGWGNDITLKTEAQTAIERLKNALVNVPTQKIKCLGLTKQGHPLSPLVRKEKEDFKIFDLKNYRV